MSVPQKYRHRKRLQRVDRIVDCVSSALAKQGTTISAIERWKDEMPTEAEMEPRDKYTIFDRKAKGYRKGVHSKGCPAAAAGPELTRSRGAQVDQSQPESQPRRFLDVARVYYISILSHFTHVLLLCDEHWSLTKTIDVSSWIAKGL